MKTTVKQFEIENRQIQITTIHNGWALISDGSVNSNDIARFESHFDCKLRLISPYQRHGGASLHISFTIN
jgi:hypothetical protein